MPIPQLPGAGLNTLDDVKSYILRLERELRFLMESGLDSTNLFEAGGWRVKESRLASKDGDVGMSTADNVADPVRFFASPIGDGTWKFYVLKSGKMFALDGTFKGHIDALSGTIGGFAIVEGKLYSVSGAGIIEGGTVRTAAENNQRIEMSSGSFKGYTADNLPSGLWFDPNKINDIVDLFLYHRGAKLVEFYDDVTQYKIRGATGATGFRLGGNNVTTYADGPWSFSNASVSGIPQSAIDNLVSRLNAIENDIDNHEGRIIALENP